MRIEWGTVDYSNYESKIKQTLTYIQNMATLRQIFVEYKIEIIVIIIQIKFRSLIMYYSKVIL